MHSHEQNLTCRLCGKTFIRLGGFITHIEQDQCPSLKLKDALSLKSKHDDQQNTVSNRQSSAGNDPSVKSDPVDLVSDFDNRTTNRCSDELIKQLRTVQDQQEDLMTFDTASNQLSATWNRKHPNLSSQVSDVSFSRRSGTDVTNIMDEPVVYDCQKTIMPVGASLNTPAKSISYLRDNAISKVNQKPLFPDTPPAETVSATLAGALTRTPVKKNSMGEFDPDSPGFDVHKYYNRFSEKFKCPHSGCP